MSSKRKESIDLLARFLILLFVILVMAILKPEAFFTATNLRQVVLEQGPFTILMGTGMSLAIISGGIDISMSSVMVLAAYLSGTAFIEEKWLLGIVIAFGVGGAFGLLNGILISKVKIVPFIATYCSDFIALGLAYVVCDGKYIYGFSDGFRSIVTGHLIPGLPNVALITILILAGLYILTKKTIFGRGFYSVGFNREATKLSGIRSDRTLILVYLTNGLIAALVGILYLARLNAADPTIRGSLTMDSLAASLVGGVAMIGGTGSIINTVIGALIILFIRNGMNIMNVPTTWTQVSVGLVIMFSLFYEAVMNGLFAKLSLKRGENAKKD